MFFFSVGSVISVVKKNYISQTLNLLGYKLNLYLIHFNAYLILNK